MRCENVLRFLSISFQISALTSDYQSFFVSLHNMYVDYIKCNSVTAHLFCKQKLRLDFSHFLSGSRELQFKLLLLRGRLLQAGCQ